MDEIRRSAKQRGQQGAAKKINWGAILQNQAAPLTEAFPLFVKFQPAENKKAPRVSWGQPRNSLSRGVP
jgi:hypothetical protein